MRSSICASIAFGGTLIVLAACAPANTPAAYSPAGQPQTQTPVAATPAPATGQPGFMRPYPEGQGDTDGLSRDPEDGDRGGIGGNPD